MTAVREARISDYDDLTYNPFDALDEQFGIVDINYDPNPRFHALRETAAVQKGDIRAAFGLEPFAMWADMPSYLVFGYDLVAEALKDSARFSNELLRRMYEDSFGLSINDMDAPDHIRYRALFMQAFSPKALRDWGDTLIPRVIDGIIGDFRGQGRADLVREFTIRFPFAVIYAQLGLPEEELPIFHRLSAGLMCIMTDHVHGLEASRKLGHYFGDLLRDRRGQPGDDLITRLANAEVRGERLPDAIAVSFLRQLMNAAGDTTYRASGSMLTGLLLNPDQLAAVRADRTLVPAAVEEALRWEGPLPTLVRSTTCPIELAGVSIPAGAKLDVVTASANRDPAHFRDPDRFDIHRKPAPHFAFAYGAHICLGQHLARIEMARALNALLDALPGLRLDPDFPPPVVSGFSTRAPTAIHVRFDS